jgi:hypothetical protein
LTFDIPHMQLQESNRMDANKRIDKSELFLVREYSLLGIELVSKPEE